MLFVCVLKQYSCLLRFLSFVPFQVQWRGFVLSPTSSPVTFTAVTDGSVRLYINRVVVLNGTALTGGGGGGGVHVTPLVAKPVVIGHGTLGEIILEYERAAAGSMIRLEVMWWW
jgi:hypothetical protein